MNIPYVFKKCSKCGEWLVANTYNFNKHKKGKFNLRSQCKKCANKYYNDNKDKKLKYSKEYYNNNRDEILRKQKENQEHKTKYHNKWYKNNKDKYKEYYNNNRDEILRKQKENYEYNKEYYDKYYKNNRDKMLKYSKEYYKNNKENIKEYNKQYRKENPEKIFNNRIKRRSKLENQGRGITKEQWEELNIFFNWECAYSNIQLNRENRSIDHILALDNGGLNEPWNCVPMVKSYNSSKNKRIDVLNWYMEQEYFDIDRLDKIVEWQIYAYEKWGGEEFGELILIIDLFEEE